MKTVKKVWGKEEWIINCGLYCGKLLHVAKGAQSSLHYHKEKQETFYGLEGQVGLAINGTGFMLNPHNRPKTIMPGTPHQFMGLGEENIILEISTQHKESDVVRLTNSQAAIPNS